MAKLTQRTVLLVDDLIQGEVKERLTHMARYATGLSATHNIIIATHAAAVAEMKQEVSKRKSDHHAHIRVIGYRPNRMVEGVKFLSSHVYRLLWNFSLSYYLKHHEVDFDLVHVNTTDRYPVSHFLWRLKRPIVWGELETTPCMRRDMILPFYGMGAYLSYTLKRFAKSMVFYLDPFLAKALYKTDRIMVSSGSCIDPIMVDASRKMKQIGFPLEMPKRLSLKPGGQNFNFVCFGTSDYRSGFDVVIKSFAEMLNDLAPELRSKPRLTMVNTGQRNAKLTNLVKDLSIGNQIHWIDDPSEEEVKEVYLSAFAYITASSKVKDMNLVKAMAYGIPLVALDTGSIRDYVGEAGIKVTVGSRGQIIKDMSFALRRLIMEPELSKAYALLALSRFRNYFTYTSYVQHNLQLFEDLYMRYNYYKRFKGRDQEPIEVVEPLVMG